MKNMQNPLDSKLKAVVADYATSVINMINSITKDNINQTISLIKANIKVLEDDVNKSFHSVKEDYKKSKRLYN